MLTRKQIKDFQVYGWVSGPSFLNESDLAELRDELVRVVGDRHSKVKRQPVRIDNLSDTPNRPAWHTINIWMASDAFDRLMRRPSILEEAAQLTRAEQLRVWHDEALYEPISTEHRSPWRQAAPTWSVLQPLDRQLTVWVALDDVDETTGGPQVVSGSHLWGDRTPWLASMPDDAPCFEGRTLEPQPIRLVAGRMCYLHPLIWQRVHRHENERPRRAVALHYMTERTLFRAAGQYEMKHFIKTPDHTPLTEDIFKLVWAHS